MFKFIGTNWVCESTSSTIHFMKSEYRVFLMKFSASIELYCECKIHIIF